MSDLSEMWLKNYENQQAYIKQLEKENELLKDTILDLKAKLEVVKLFFDGQGGFEK